MIDPRHVAPTPESVGLDPALVDALLERAGKEVREGVLPSAQIAIARNGKIAAMRSFGRVFHHGVEALILQQGGEMRCIGVDIGL